MRTNTAGQRDGLENQQRIEAFQNAGIQLAYDEDGKVVALNANTEQSDKAIREWRLSTLSDSLVANDYLNGDKSLSDYDWTKTNSLEQAEYRTATAFSSWLKSLTNSGLGFEDLLIREGIMTEDEISTIFGGVPLSYDNILAFVASEYKNLSDRNLDPIWEAAFGQTGGVGESLFVQAQTHMTGALLDLWLKQAGDFTMVDKMNRDQTESLIDEFLTSVVAPYIGADSADFFKPYMMNQLEANGLFDEDTTSSEAVKIFENVRDGVINAAFIDSDPNIALDFDNWARRYITPAHEANQQAIATWDAQHKKASQSKAAHDAWVEANELYQTTSAQAEGYAAKVKAEEALAVAEADFFTAVENLDMVTISSGYSSA